MNPLARPAEGASGKAERAASHAEVHADGSASVLKAGVRDDEEFVSVGARLRVAPRRGELVRAAHGVVVD